MPELNPEPNKALSDYISVTEIVKEFNKKYKYIYPKLSKAKVVSLCKDKDIALYTFASDANFGARTYVSKTINIEEMLGELLIPDKPDNPNKPDNPAKPAP